MLLPRLAAAALLSASLLTGLAGAAEPLQVPGLSSSSLLNHGDEVLASDQAFVLESLGQSAIKTGANQQQLLQLRWTIAPGYYLYRDQLKLSDAQGQPLALEIPAGETLSDAFFGTVQVFHQTLSVQAPLPPKAEQWPLQLQWQGCAQVGVCYPPQTQTISAQQLGLESAQGTTSLTSAPSSEPGWQQSLALPPSVLIGPLALPTMALAVFLALFLSQWWARRQQLRSGQPVEALLLRATLLGLLAARLTYVGWWWREYLEPLPAGLLQIIDIRDGGFNLWAGLLAALGWALWRSRGQTLLRRGTLQALAAGALILIAAHALRTWTEPQKQPLPALSLVNASAQTVDLRSYQGQPLVINLWATWCPHCRREMPVLAQAQKEHPGVRFVWINQGEDAQAVLRYLQTMQLPPDQVLLDPQQQASQHWRQRGLPSTYFYDGQGRLRSTRMGELSRASLAEHLAGISPLPAP
ncbi:redoxin [Comamonas testosteroni]|uniref:Redoxin n=1 Tax=Comamonas testosteroni TaxID=285 RepID=A0A373FU73_COMTE|nr:prolipoprotein diacylglyceryl transferase family protein [Comamonas testosteroni]RGE46949.1 redoxin [Comamonas testosteroni]